MSQEEGMFYNGRLEIGMNELALINMALVSSCDYIFLNNKFTV